MEKLRRMIRTEVKKALKESTWEKDEALAEKIHKVIMSVDPSMDNETFARAIAIVLSEHYGEHNLNSFISELKNFFHYKNS